MVGGAVFGWSSWMVVVGMIRIGWREDAVCRGWMDGLWFVLGGAATVRLLIRLLSGDKSRRLSDISAIQCGAAQRGLPLTDLSV